MRFENRKPIDRFEELLDNFFTRNSKEEILEFLKKFDEMKFEGPPLKEYLKNLNSMPKIIDGHILDYTPEQLDYFEAEMKEFRFPWITRSHKKVGVPLMRYSFFPALALIAMFGIISMENAYNDWAWYVAKYMSFFYIGVIGLFTLISKIFERASSNKLRKKLKLSWTDFNILVIAFQITGM